MTDRDSIRKNPVQLPESIGMERIFSLATPIEANVAHSIGRDIVSGKFQPDTRLPDEASMLKRYSVSRTAYRPVGSGVKVCPRPTPAMPLIEVTSFGSARLLMS